MKLSKGCVPEAFKVRDKRDGQRYDCVIQNYKDSFSGVEYPRFNIGINGWTEWSFVAYYNEQDFNKYFEVI